jgi:hypothetical protein
MTILYDIWRLCSGQDTMNRLCLYFVFYNIQLGHFVCLHPAYLLEIVRTHTCSSLSPLSQAQLLSFDFILVVGVVRRTSRYVNAIHTGSSH